ncbi:hypothetical protein N6H18_13350 [Reichenbachiella agarivorans]|uniref:Phage protein n=1 Tax=Reichenbachiella agarivorans TaxID=2979464 RepID=A0ABY6CST6_9BACT|nr:hypothetical protein [Reichenbachiella agarivorans]UXP31335.1 hypothetical protein N6H18_13350 [Reichenbachiella agarivorans]
MDTIEIVAIGWSVIALILFGIQANQIHIDNKEDHWHIKQEKKH